MKRKSLSFLVIFTMLFTLTAAGTWPQTASGAPNKAMYKPSLPSYQKLDKDLLQDAKANGQTLKGKELHGINGGAYFKPGTTGALTPIDAKGSRKGIAIMVDFPVENTEGKVSDVPGVDFQPVSKDLFVDLLDGQTYDPYSAPQFAQIKAEATKLGITCPTDRTLNNYYKEVSKNNFSIDVDVVGWYELPHNYNYYMGQNLGYYNENGDAHIGELVMDAIKLAHAGGVDFSAYAVDAKAGDFSDLYGNATSFNDENGNPVTKIVPNIFIIHRGTGAEYSGDPSIIWSHKWDILSANYFGQYYQTGAYPSDASLKYEVVDGVAVNTYNICPEVGQDITEYYTKPAGKPKRMASPADPGVFCHEFGHVLGLPDQYDYGYESEGTGMFTLMASGSYGRDINNAGTLNRYFSGFSPVHMDAWSKYYLGFATPEVITPTTAKVSVTLNPSSSDNANFYKILVPGANGKEYFLLENRQQTGYDKGLAYNGTNLHGLVVYHVDENVFVRNFHRPNEAANWDWNNRGKNYKDPGTGENHYAIGVVSADGRWDMDKGINDGDAGDVFPGTSSVTLLSPNVTSNPNTLSYIRWTSDSRNYTGITIDNIVEKDGIVTANVYLK